MTKTPAGNDPARLDIGLLHAFADGELAPDEAARVVLHLADCPADQELVNGIMATNAMIARACAGPMQEPVPPRIRSAIFGPPAPVGAAPPARRGGVLRFAGLGGALAAGLAALAVWLPTGGDPALPTGPVAVRSPVAEALTQLATGESRLVAQDTRLDVTGSFAVRDGYCREVSLDRDKAVGVVALACHGPEGWRIAARQEVEAINPEVGYFPAGGDEDDPVGAYLDAVNAGPVLSAEQEAAARASGWR
ncbi:anti-sigma factor family protein [Paracoccus sp. (in: a-proteobacteria)]|uniref:anti-sigma factor family protein n=1 Tax=Paracoccus sp. TaxID=267 RepID=UPI003A855C57